MTTPSLHLRLPATSANLGPGFDALGLAMSLYLTIEASVAEAGAFHIDATGRDAAACSVIEDNLILTTYIDVLANAGKLSPRLHLKLHNEIPLGMGCGSSAAALLAGVMLANHFGQLLWSPQQVLEEACRREGHPDNVAACFLGGMTVSSVSEDAGNYCNLQGKHQLEPSTRPSFRQPLHQQGASPPSRPLHPRRHGRQHSGHGASGLRLRPSPR